VPDAGGPRRVRRPRAGHGRRRPRHRPPAAARRAPRAPPPATPPFAAALASGKTKDLHSVRYFALDHLDGPKQKEAVWRLLSAHVNQLSREPVIVPPLLVLDGPVKTATPDQMKAELWSKVVLARVDIRDYRWDPKVWEKLSDADVHFHATVKVTETYREEEVEDWPGGTDRDGRYYEPGRYRTGRFATHSKSVRKRTAAPWLDPADVRVLTDALDTDVPVVMADFFLWQTLQEVDRNPAYHDFLGFKDLKTFNRLVAFDEKVSDDFLSELRAAVALSGVSKQPRRITRYDKVGGGYWATGDSKVAVGDNNPLRQLDDKFRFDAAEVYAHLSNGLWAMGLFNALGVRQDSAPDFVGRDKTTTSNDGRIHAPLSCIKCHANGGLKEIDDWTRNLLTPPPLALQSPDKAVFLDLRRKYLRHLEPHLDADRAKYVRALAECNGMTPRQFASAVGEFWLWYDNTPVALDRAEAELGCKPGELVAALNHRLKTRGDADLVLGVYLLPPDRAKGIPIDQWREAVPLAQQFLAEYRGAKK
jgi:hypothetical protein